MRDQKTWSLRFMSVMGVAHAVAVARAGGHCWQARACKPARGRRRTECPAVPGTRQDRGQAPCLTATPSRPGRAAALSPTSPISGSVAFAFPETRPLADATDRVFTKKTAVLQRADPVAVARSPTPFAARRHQPLRRAPGVSKAIRRRDPAITISNAILRAIDENRNPSGCPPKTVSDCPLRRGVVLFHARATRLGRE